MSIGGLRNWEQKILSPRKKFEDHTWVRARASIFFLAKEAPPASCSTTVHSVHLAQSVRQPTHSQAVTASGAAAFQENYGVRLTPATRLTRRAEGVGLVVLIDETANILEERIAGLPAIRT